MIHRIPRLPLFLLAIATVARLAPAATFTYPDFNVDPAVFIWDATAGIASGDTVVLQNGSGFTSSNDPITNSGTLELRGGFAFNNPYVFSLGMTGTGGVVVSNNAFASLTGTNSYSGGTLIDQAALIATTASLPGNVNNQGVLRFDQSGNGTFAGNITGGGRLERYGTGTVTLTGTITTPSETYNDPFGGRLVGNTNTIKGVVRNDGANLEFAQNFDGTFNGDFGQSVGSTGDTGNVYKTGSGALTLTGNNRLQIAGQSDLYIEGGRVQGPAESLDFNGTITVSSGAELRLIQGNEVNNMLMADITGAGIVRKTGTGTVMMQGSNTYAGPTIVEGGQLQFNLNNLPKPDGSGTYSDFQLTGSGSGNSTGITVSAGGSGPDLEFNGLISGSGSLTVTQYGAAGLELTAANTYTGGSFINAGRLVGSTQTMPGPITFLNGSELASEVVFKQSVNGTAAYPITGYGTIYKTGAGTLTLTSTASTVEGVMYVDGGKVVVNGAMPNVGTTQVRSGAVLGGSGSIGTNIGSAFGVVVTDGTVAPGNSAGVLTMNNLELGGAQTGIEWELMTNTAAAAARGTSFDGIDLTAGTLTVPAGTVLDLVFNAPGSNVHWWNGVWDQNQSWLLIDGVTSIGGFSGLPDPIFAINSSLLDSVGGDLASLRPGAGFTTSYDSGTGDILINYTSAQLVPEPATLGLAGLAALGGLGLLRRRRRA